MRKTFKRLLLKNKDARNNLFKFTLVSDTHIDTDAVDNEDYPNLSGPPMYYYTIGKKMDDFIQHVNSNKPNAVIHLGDVIEAPNPKESFEYFMERWNMIDASITKSISAGNHDYTYRVNDNELGLSNHEYVSEKLGYGDRPYIAGSKMNESFSVYEKDLGVRFINFDTNMIDETTFRSDGGYLSDTMIDWIEGELLNCDENIAFVYSHRGRNFLVDDSDTRFQTMISDVMTQRPELKVYVLYGHSHRPDLWEYTSEIGGFPIFNCSALVDNLESEFYTFYVSEAGIHSVDTHWAKYP